MEVLTQAYGFLVALGIGLFIGLEREKSEDIPDEQSVSGIRTFTLISLLGASCSLLLESGNSLLMSFIAGGVMLLVVLGYYLSSSKTRDIGVTTEFAQILVFTLGFLAYNPQTRKVSVILAVTSALILALKESLHDIVENIREYELIDTLKFAVIAFIVLPLLPNQAVDPWGVINPHEIWLLVVLISGISYVGYVATKILGVDRGLGLTGLLGGLSSSTAVTTAMADKSRREAKIVKPAAFAAIIASNVMFPRIAVEVFVVNRQLVWQVLPALAAMGGAGVFAGFIIWHKREKTKSEIKLDSPFALKPALKFGAFFIIVLLVQYFAKEQYGSSGLYGVSLLSGLADVDAITLSTARMGLKGDITDAVAVNAIILAAMSNTLMKFIYAYVIGGREFARLVGFASIAMIAAGAAATALF